MSFVQWNAIHRADLLALRFVVVADALGAQVRVDHVDLFALGNGGVRALGFADVAVDAIVGDDQGHANSSLGGKPGRNKPMRIIVPHWRQRCTQVRRTVGASLLAMNPRTPRGVRFPALSLTSIASRLAPTVLRGYFLKRSVRASATAGCTNLVISPPRAAISRTSVEEMNE